MTLARAGAAIGLVVMAAAILYGLIIGEFFAEARILFAEPWFHVSMIDLYAGFLIVAAWIFFRERSRLTAVVWLILLLTLGNLTSFVYILIAAARSNGDWRRFWMGARADEAP